MQFNRLRAKCLAQVQYFSGFDVCFYEMISIIVSLHRFSQLVKHFSHEQEAKVTPPVQIVTVGVWQERRAVSTNGQTRISSILTRNHLNQREFLDSTESKVNLLITSSLSTTSK